MATFLSVALQLSHNHFNQDSYFFVCVKLVCFDSKFEMLHFKSPHGDGS